MCVCVRVGAHVFTCVHICVPGYVVCELCAHVGALCTRVWYACVLCVWAWMCRQGKMGVAGRGETQGHILPLPVVEPLVL